MIKLIINWFNALFPKPPKYKAQVFCRHCGRAIPRRELEGKE